MIGWRGGPRVMVMRPMIRNPLSGRRILWACGVQARGAAGPARPQPVRLNELCPLMVGRPREGPLRVETWGRHSISPGRVAVGVHQVPEEWLNVLLCHEGLLGPPRRLRWLGGA
jgi:hypothetical protein